MLVCTPGSVRKAERAALCYPPNKTLYAADPSSIGIAWKTEYDDGNRSAAADISHENKDVRQVIADHNRSAG